MPGNSYTHGRGSHLGDWYNWLTLPGYGHSLFFRFHDFQWKYRHVQLFLHGDCSWESSKSYPVRWQNPNPEVDILYRETFSSEFLYGNTIWKNSWKTKKSLVKFRDFFVKNDYSYSSASSTASSINSFTKCFDSTSIPIPMRREAKAERFGVSGKR